ncbi:MAG: glycosyltransferase [Lautropia sp.]|nr:glycosyltransferase [Lautropia sp.]
MDNLIPQVIAFRPKRLVAPFEQSCHVPFVAWLVRQHRPRLFLELGSTTGNIYFAVCQVLAEQKWSGRCYAVSTWQTDIPGGPSAEQLYSDFRDYNVRTYGAFSWITRMRPDQALVNVDGASLDLLLIDGSLKAADGCNMRDWKEKLSDRAIVLVVGTQAVDTAATRYWQQQIGQAPDAFFPHADGLGVWILGAGVPDEIRAAVRRNDTEAAHQLFRALGEGSLGIYQSSHLQPEVESLSRQLATCSTELLVARQEAMAQQSELKALKQRHEEASRSLREVSDGYRQAVTEVARLNASLQEIQKSSSWRASAPIRWVGGPLRQARYKVGVTRQAIALRGGYKATLGQTLNVLRRDGWQGIRTRFGAALNPVSTSVPGAPLPESLYHEWLLQNDPIDAATLATLKARIEALDLNTRFSVVMPVYNPPLDFLRQAIESVQAQIYPHWEFCIADDASPRQEVKDMLSEMAAADPRIKLVFCEQNGGISAASNAALGIATGDFVALLDNDDLLSPHALAYMALAVHQRPDAGLFYSDEDKISEANVRHDPYFKCQFNYELFLAQNMISHLGVYRRDVMEQVGGFRKGYEGAQDWDLALRVIETIGHDKVVHVPRVLYHWRVLPGSTALAVDQKAYALSAQEKTLKSHLERMERSDSTVSRVPGFPGLLRVRHAIPSPAPRVGIVIPTRDRYELISTCIDTILQKTQYPNYEVIVVDNGTTDAQTLAYFKQMEQDVRVRIIRADIPFNFSKLVNLGAESSRGEYVVLLNNDIEIIQADWIEEMLSFACQDGVGCVGARLWYPNGTIQHAGVVLGMGGVAGHPHIGTPKGSPGYFGRAVVHQVYSAVTAACLMVRKSIYEEVKGYDEALQVAFNDVDFCIKVREQGYRNIYTPFAEFIHHESASRGSDLVGEKRARFVSEVELMTQRWAWAFQNDPAYSLNLALDSGDFSLAWPSRVGEAVISETRRPA